MHLKLRKGPLAIRLGLMAGAVALAIFMARSAGAQGGVVFDGNIVWNNGATGVEHYVGQAPVGACSFDSTTVLLATARYTRNNTADPLLSGALNILAPNFRPGAGSPAFCGNSGHGLSMVVPNDGFFTATDFVGALGPTGEDWTQGWTIYTLDGTGRTDTNNGRPLVLVDNHNFYSNRTFSADSNYVIRGQLRVKDQATLSIQAGVVIFQEKATVGTIIIERGAKIDAQGTKAAPIIITSDEAPGAQNPGGSGGLFIHGRAKTNVANTCAGDSAASEGGSVGFYGGNNDSDNSGTLRYVRVEFSGNEVAPNNEANAFTFNAVGDQTVAEYLQATRSSDDLFEWFGGTMQAGHLVGTYGQDDGLDWQMGFRGKIQFAVIRQLATDSEADRGVEADNNENNNDELQCSGRSNPTLANVTLVGDRTTGAGGVDRGIELRRGTNATILNSIITEWKTAALRLNNSATWVDHCNAAPAGPAEHCPGGTVSVPGVANGKLFYSQGYPNPFRANVAIRFALPAESMVTIEVYEATGRLVKRLGGRLYPAGEHSVRWDMGQRLPTGMYFYRVVADDIQLQSAGKLTRID